VFVDLPQSSMSFAAMTTDARGGAITAWLDRRFGVGGLKSTYSATAAMTPRLRKCRW
jgi:hypothetical protein